MAMLCGQQDMLHFSLALSAMVVCLCLEGVLLFGRDIEAKRCSWNIELGAITKLQRSRAISLQVESIINSQKQWKIKRFSVHELRSSVILRVLEPFLAGLHIDFRNSRHQGSVPRHSTNHPIGWVNPLQKVQNVETSASGLCKLYWCLNSVSNFPGLNS